MKNKLNVYKTITNEFSQLKALIYSMYITNVKLQDNSNLNKLLNLNNMNFL